MYTYIHIPGEAEAPRVRGAEGQPLVTVIANEKH